MEIIVESMLKEFHIFVILVDVEYDRFFVPSSEFKVYLGTFFFIKN